jgi:hypothetical protein
MMSSMFHSFLHELLWGLLKVLVQAFENRTYIQFMSLIFFIKYDLSYFSTHFFTFVIFYSKSMAIKPISFTITLDNRLLGLNQNQFLCHFIGFDPSFV